jgi:hypothetical protein
MRSQAIQHRNKTHASVRAVAHREMKAGDENVHWNQQRGDKDNERNGQCSPAVMERKEQVKQGQQNEREKSSEAEYHEEKHQHENRLDECKPRSADVLWLRIHERVPMTANVRAEAGRAKVVRQETRASIRPCLQHAC